MVHAPLPQTLPGLGEKFNNADEALARIQQIYAHNTTYLRERFAEFGQGKLKHPVAAHYPYVAVSHDRTDKVDSRLSFGFLPKPGVYSTTLTRPDLFGRYYRSQLELLIKNHGVQIEVGVASMPIPVHFAFAEGIHVEADLSPDQLDQLQNMFDVPSLTMVEDDIVDGRRKMPEGGPYPLALFTAPRVDYSLHRLRHYSATSPQHFQNYVIFTNYQFYIDGFVKLCHELMSKSDDPAEAEYRRQYTAFVEPGGYVTPNANLSAEAASGVRAARLPQMPAYHLVREDHSGITMVNIGVGPANAKNITDHIAVMRPHAWMMLGHCAGLRNSQRLGDYVLAHAYVRDDHVLDEDLPLWVPVPALAEMQQALQTAAGKVTGRSGFDLKSVLRTGTVATTDNRNWELMGYDTLVQRFALSRAIAMDMESATIAANGFRFRVPYGTLLCVSDKPLHGEIKLPGMANKFYQEQVGQHLKIGVKAMELLRENGLEKLHSRKLRSFFDAPFQ